MRMLRYVIMFFLVLHCTPALGQVNMGLPSGAPASAAADDSIWECREELESLQSKLSRLERENSRLRNTVQNLPSLVARTEAAARKAVEQTEAMDRRVMIFWVSAAAVIVVVASMLAGFYFGVMRKRTAPR